MVEERRRKKKETLKKKKKKASGKVGLVARRTLIITQSRLIVCTRESREGWGRWGGRGRGESQSETQRDRQTD